MSAGNLRINWPRLQARLDRLAEIGAGENGACCRLALTADDKAGRDLVLGWMRELDLEVRIDAIGNIIALRKGLE
ncbi:MAG TPA: Zn-dependent hydrolase, partial [Stellaceae bacterium]|nr:Zn-dependent hydrolase [Stellaceae bacterium]